MACTVKLTNRAWRTYEANLDYLQEQWTDKEVRNFIELVDKKIFTLSKHPALGKSRNKKNPHIRYTLVHKRVALIYKYLPIKKKYIF
mgnify:CR=1 FL=1